MSGDDRMKPWSPNRKFDWTGAINSANDLASRQFRTHCHWLHGEEWEAEWAARKAKEVEKTA